MIKQLNNAGKMLTFLVGMSAIPIGAVSQGTIDDFINLAEQRGIVGYDNANIAVSDSINPDNDTNLTVIYYAESFDNPSIYYFMENLNCNAIVIDTFHNAEMTAKLAEMNLKYFCLEENNSADILDSIYGPVTNIKKIRQREIIRKVYADAKEPIYIVNPAGRRLPENAILNTRNAAGFYSDKNSRKIRY